VGLYTAVVAAGVVTFLLLPGFDVVIGFAESAASLV